MKIIMTMPLFNGSITEKQGIATKTPKHQENQVILVKSTLVSWWLSMSFLGSRTVPSFGL